MYRKIGFRPLLLTTALAGLVPAGAHAQEAPQQAATTSSIEDIVVTARRGAESLQNVPVSVQVVTGDSLQKLAITSVEEVSKLAPGLTLVNAGSSTAVTLRGVTWQPGSGTPATPIYFNEVPFDPGNTIVSLFDVGQIEVLRGPQGTTRGAPSISGAVTIATRKPDLTEFGGYVQGLYGSGDHFDLQGAINAPIIKDVLAIRLAANIEESNGNRVRSVNSRIDPFFRDRTYRATVLFKPTDTLSIQGMYQRRKTLDREYFQVVGTGSPGAPARLGGLVAAIPANFNGPALTLDDRASVQDQPIIRPQHVDLATINANWEVLGHNLSYNYGRQINRSGTVLSSLDQVNSLPGFEAYSVLTIPGTPKFRTHEIRISSLPDPDRPFDYDIGWFSKRSSGITRFDVPVYYLPGTLGGAFGPPTAAPGTVTTPDSRYVLQSSTNIRLGQVFDSFYGNVRFHLDDATELTGGLAILRDRVPLGLDITTAATRAIATPLAALGGLPCAGIPGVFVTGLVNSVYPGFCDAQIPAGSGNSSQSNNDKYSKPIYNFSLSHRFTDDLLVYATTGSSFRTGLPAVNNPGLPDNLITPRPETAKSYEIGVKSSIGRRLRINASAFQLDYKNQLTTFEGINYFNTISRSAALTSLAFYSNIDARVRGAEVEIAAEPIDNLSLTANLSYSKIKSRGGQVPCNDTARPVTAANPIDLCASPKGQVLNTQSPFQATLNGSYDLPITDLVAAYVRFNANYRNKNPNFGNFGSQNAGGVAVYRKTRAYTIVDLFAGITGNRAGWDLGVYAKNVFDKNVELTRLNVSNTIYQLYAAGDGYDQVRTNRPREIGATLRYAFGSR
ncbi:TonB-dependent receptor [Sphingomonas solaris]|uniref:TonB-dependent receptor n=1 Tax=Alterirhizorhabdus solaris TaxID=2529389 RepID=A0A558RA57_9SPHN|nr:TonB-dependent receptor [Sphingomonas solaris]TVV76266.1 hypothetical protein FOY91_05015 [Sphingomonas solaris]